MRVKSHAPSGFLNRYAARSETKYMARHVYGGKKVCLNNYDKRSKALVDCQPKLGVSR